MLNILCLLTFPGIIIHEYSHKKACNISNIPVQKVKYLKLEPPHGLVIHSKPLNLHTSLFISIAPLLLNTSIAILIFLISIRIIYINTLSTMSLITSTEIILFLWMGFSLSFNALPSMTDSKNVYNLAKRYITTNPLALLIMPIIAIIYVGNRLRKIGFHFFYVALTLLVSLYLYRYISGSGLSFLPYI